MITLYVAKMESTPQGAFITFRIFGTPEDAQEFRMPIPSYDMKAWAESVGAHVNLDPKILANEKAVLLTPAQAP